MRRWLKKPEYQVVFMLQFFISQSLSRWANTEREYSTVKICGEGYKLCPFLILYNYIGAKKNAKTPSSSLIQEFSHALYSQGHILPVNRLNIMEALPFFLHSPCLVCRHSFWGSLGTQGPWHKLKSQGGDVSAFLPEPSLPFIVFSKTKRALNFPGTRLWKDRLSPPHPRLWRHSKKERTSLFLKQSSKRQRETGVERRELCFQTQKEKKKVKQGIFFLLPRKL